MEINIFPILGIFLFIHFPLSAQTNYPFQNTALTDNVRLDNLLSVMILDEKGMSCPPIREFTLPLVCNEELMV